MKNIFLVSSAILLLTTACGKPFEGKRTSPPSSTNQQPAKQTEGDAEASSALQPEAKPAAQPTQGGIEKNTCLITNQGDKKFPHPFPFLVKINPELLNNPKVPFVPVFHKTNNPFQFGDRYVIYGPTLNPDVYLSDWQWTINRLGNGTLGLRKLYVNTNAAIPQATEGTQIEFGKFNEFITFEDKDNQLRISCFLTEK